jgi:hypothetical protein
MNRFTLAGLGLLAWLALTGGAEGAAQHAGVLHVASDYRDPGLAPLAAPADAQPAQSSDGAGLAAAPVIEAVLHEAAGTWGNVHAAAHPAHAPPARPAAQAVQAPPSAREQVEALLPALALS